MASQTTKAPAPVPVPASPTPALLLPYQAAWVADTAQIKIAEKGRRTGLTFAEAADDVLIAARANGENVYYISGNYDMAREYIESVVVWARTFDFAASEVGEGLWGDHDANASAADKYIKTFEVVFPGSGHRITALSSRPTNLRGKQGTVVIDEAAFAPDLGQLLKAAIAMTLRGSRIRIISTHNGVDNPFAELIADARAGKRGIYGPGKEINVHHIPFSLAVEEGMFHQICARKQVAWTQAGQDAWVAKVKAMYKDDADEELEAIPAQSGGTYLPLALIEQRMANGVPLVRGKWDVAFTLQAEEVRRLAIKGWLAENIDPVLSALNPMHRHRFGWDFARVADLSVLLVTEQESSLVRRVAMVVELAGCPFASQEQILWHIIERLPRFSGGAMDAGGNGAHVAETTALRYGVQLVHQVKLSRGWYVEHMPKLKANLEDGTLERIPRDESLQQDLRSVKVIGGVPQVASRVVTKDTEGVKLSRHGDFAIAAVMECYITQAEVAAVAWESAPAKVQPNGQERNFFGRSNSGFGYSTSMEGW